MRLRTCVLKGAINLCFSQAKYESKKKSLLHYVEITRNVDLVAREARPQAVCRSYGHDFRLGGTRSLCVADHILGVDNQSANGRSSRANHTLCSASEVNKGFTKTIAILSSED